MSEYSQDQRFHGSHNSLNFNQSANSWDPARSCSMTSYGLWEVVLHSGGATMTSHNYHGGLHVVLGEWYKNAYNLKNSNMSGTILIGLPISSSITEAYVCCAFSFPLTFLIYGDWDQFCQTCCHICLFSCEIYYVQPSYKYTDIAHTVRAMYWPTRYSYCWPTCEHYTCSRRKMLNNIYQIHTCRSITYWNVELDLAGIRY